MKRKTASPVKPSHAKRGEKRTRFSSPNRLETVAKRAVVALQHLGIGWQTANKMVSVRETHVEVFVTQDQDGIKHTLSQINARGAELRMNGNVIIHRVKPRHARPSRV